MRWLVLVVLMFGTITSSMGVTNSHGLAAIGAVFHAHPSSPDEPHGHVHENPDGDSGMLDHGAGAAHPHHGPDHSHDNAHALPAAWRSAPRQIPAWFGLVRPWIEMVQPSRLERPPMG